MPRAEWANRPSVSLNKSNTSPRLTVEIMNPRKIISTELLFVLLYDLLTTKVKFHTLSTVVAVETQSLYNQYVLYYGLAYSPDFVTFNDLVDVSGTNAVRLYAIINLMKC